MTRPSFGMEKIQMFALSQFARRLRADVSIAACLMGVLVPVAGVVFNVPGLHAQQAAAQQPAFQQRPLTEDLIKSFIAADADVAAVTSKMPEGMEKPDEATLALLNAAARKHNFKDFDDYVTIANNIAAVLAGLDPESGEYSDPRPSIDKQIEAVKADQQMSKEDKEAMLGELEDLKKIAVPIEHKGNIALVQKFRNALSQMQ